MTTVVEEMIDHGHWCDNCHQSVNICRDMGCDNCDECGTAPTEE